MKNKKMTIQFFDVMEYDKEAAYLSRMHREGWKFRQLRYPFFYMFDKCEPKDVRYQLDYNQEGIENKEEYVQMFEDCGWEYMFDKYGYSYFRKAAGEEEEDNEIFCDEESRMDMIMRVYKGRILPLIAIFCLIILPQFYLAITRSNIGVLIFWIVLAALYIAIFAKFIISYRKLRNNLK